MVLGVKRRIDARRISDVRKKNDPRRLLSVVGTLVLTSAGLTSIAHADDKSSSFWTLPAIFGGLSWNDASAPVSPLPQSGAQSGQRMGSPGH